MYWVETVSDISIIKQSTLSGKHIHLVVGNAGKVTAIMVDPLTSILYWTSAVRSSSQLNAVESDGSGRKSVILGKADFSPSSLTFDQSYLYWTDM